MEKAIENATDESSRIEVLLLWIKRLYARSTRTFGNPDPIWRRKMQTMLQGILQTQPNHPAACHCQAFLNLFFKFILNIKIVCSTFFINA